MTKLKIGDKVVMNDRYYDKHQGEVFTIKAGPEMIGRKECFWLDGYDGAYCADGLDLYKPQTNEEWFCELPTKEKAKFLFEHGVICCQFCKGDCIEIDYKTKECKYNVSPTYSYTGIIKWLKEKHDEM